MIQTYWNFLIQDMNNKIMMDRPSLLTKVSELFKGFGWHTDFITDSDEYESPSIFIYSPRSIDTWKVIIEDGHYAPNRVVFKLIDDYRTIITTYEDNTEDDVTVITKICNLFLHANS